MRFGLTDEQVAFVDKVVIEPLVSSGAKVFCFGSRARGDHRQFSDLDLMVESTAKDERLLGSIAEQVQKSNFPLKIDLVHVLDYAESYRAGYLKDRIEWCFR